MSPDDLRSAREALGMSVAELAGWLGLDGAHGRTSVREMESGKRSISGPICRAVELASSDARLRSALKRLSLAAQTSGGAAGRDSDLVAAIEEAAGVLGA